MACCTNQETPCSKPQLGTKFIKRFFCQIRLGVSPDNWVMQHTCIIEIFPTLARIK
ncbi:hypothetical protein MC7420_7992 [Coleofasciculus chthonoplastes PCC 7420]|uniref:Uncharacterized protein n=1 Tax=Coleofasciculus chthonoplastes PCC 7420 TaxID=118168 RepID=B4VID5_9CYAN|nr:hypothetical protein MC7420_7992 [Coleofasciculus chthonoplastes PCC 7420]